MPLRTHIVNLYGERTYQLTKSLKSVRIKIANLNNHIVFLKRCRNQDIVPKGLRIKRKSCNPKDDGILKKAEQRLVVSTLQENKKKRASLVKQKRHLILSLENVLSQADFQAVLKATDQAENREFEKKKACHIRKFQRLQDELKSTGSSKTVVKSAVMNLSGRSLSDTEMRLLENGLGFAPTPLAVPKKEVISAVESALMKSKCPEEEKNIIRSKVSGVLQTAKVPEDNLLREKRRALQSLKGRTDIKILQADKGNTVVILSGQQYEDKMMALINDGSYRKLTGDPTAKKEKKIAQDLDTLVKKGEVTSARAKLLKPRHSTAPKMYGLPKIHKENISLRPVTSMIDSPAYNMAGFLTRIHPWVRRLMW